MGHHLEQYQFIMSSLKPIEKKLLEKMFEMEDGYVLEFSNDSYQEFIYDTLKVDIYNDKYAIYGTSKAKRLRRFWQIEDDYRVGLLIKEMLIFAKNTKLIKGIELDNNYIELFNDCMNISSRLLGVGNKTEEYDSIKNVDNSAKDEFLKKEYGNININLLDIESIIIEGLELRLKEIQTCLESKAYLSVVILAGSTLEGILLGTASRNMQKFNQSSSAPKDKENNIKKFHEWTLSDFINVAHKEKFVDANVKEYSHSLRTFRNYVHPHKQFQAEFYPDENTAKISIKVLMAAISNLSKKNLNK